MATKAAFLDRDGVINVDRGYVYRIEDFTLIDGVLEAAKRLYDAGFKLVIITNQSGIARGFYKESDLSLLNEHILKIFREVGAPLSGIYCCPHLPDAPLQAYRKICDCRKPAPGLFLKAAKELDLDLEKSLAFGDKERDLEAAKRAGVPVRLLLGKDGKEIPARSASASAVAKDLRAAVELLEALNQL